MKKLFLFAFVALGVANADLIPNLDVTMGTGGVECSTTVAICTYNYEVTVHDSSTLRGSATRTFDQFFTLYDIAGFAGATAPAGWTVSVQAIGITPDRIDPVDNPDPALNVTFFYTGAADIAGGTSVAGFQVLSVNAPDSPNALGTFTSQATKTSNGTAVRNIGEVEVPGSTPYQPSGDNPVPEPMSMGLLGSGLAALGFFARKK